MPVLSGFGVLAELPWERITDKIERRVLAGRQGMVVWWKMKAGAHAAAHQHPHEQIVWMLNGKMDFRIGSEKRSMAAGHVTENTCGWRQHSHASVIPCIKYAHSGGPILWT
jgi:quercetin dioxygenase-like cupin family protein